jgi:hypothetical protein
MSRQCLDRRMSAIEKTASDARIISEILGFMEY